MNLIGKPKIIRFVTDFLLVILEDFMDNQKSYLPRFLEKTKENQGAERLSSKISGCIVYSGHYEQKRKCVFYIHHDQVISGCIFEIKYFFHSTPPHSTEGAKVPNAAPGRWGITFR